MLGEMSMRIMYWKASLNKCFANSLLHVQFLMEVVRGGGKTARNKMRGIGGQDLEGVGKKDTDDRLPNNVLYVLLNNKVNYRQHLQVAFRPSVSGSLNNKKIETNLT